MTALPPGASCRTLRRRRDPPSKKQGPDRTGGKRTCRRKGWIFRKRAEASLGWRLAESAGTAWLGADHPARRPDCGLLAVLVLAPDLDADAGRCALGAQLLHDAADREAIAGVHGLHERDRHRAAPHEAGAEEARHHLRDVRGGHHSLRERGAEAFATRPRLVGVNRPRPHTGVRVDVALRELF